MSEAHNRVMREIDDAHSKAMQRIDDAHNKAMQRIEEDHQRNLSQIYNSTMMTFTTLLAVFILVILSTLLMFYWS